MAFTVAGQEEIRVSYFYLDRTSLLNSVVLMRMYFINDIAVVVTKKKN
jgi:hypothetical protein